MIIEALVMVVVGLFRLIVSVIPSGDPPAWVSTAGTYVATVGGWMNDFGAWIPVGLLYTVVAAVLSCIAVGFSIKAVRIVASFLTGGGGSAA